MTRGEIIICSAFEIFEMLFKNACAGQGLSKYGKIHLDYTKLSKVHYMSYMSYRYLSHVMTLMTCSDPLNRSPVARCRLMKGNRWPPGPFEDGRIDLEPGTSTWEDGW